MACNLSAQSAAAAHARPAGRRGAVRSAAAAALAATLLTGCSLLGHGPKLDEPVHLIAVLPIQRNEAANPAPGEPSRIAPGAEHIVTSEIYDVLTNSSEWDFVPDLTVTQALAKIPASPDPALRARQLGQAVNADAVLFGTVSRYVDRIGGEFGAKQPAAVGIKLQLISVKSAAILWSGSFDEEQQPLSSNLLNWWQFWSGGPKWFSAPEFTHIAVERLLGDLAKRME